MSAVDWILNVPQRPWVGRLASMTVPLGGDKTFKRWDLVEVYRSLGTMWSWSSLFHFLPWCERFCPATLPCLKCFLAARPKALELSELCLGPLLCSLDPSLPAKLQQQQTAVGHRRVGFTSGARGTWTSLPGSPFLLRKVSSHSVCRWTDSPLYRVF